MLGVSVLRNRHLADVFYRLKLIEAYGTGIPKIMSSYDNYLVKPKIEATSHAFKITLPNRNNEPTGSVPDQAVSIAANEREKQVLQLFREKKSIARKDVEMATGISQATAVLLLRDMVNKGLIQKIGSGKLVRYSLNQ
jgi:ATP-dependent DNA helicase RecG